MDCTIYVHVLDYYFRSIAGHITVYVTDLFLPIHVLYISSGLFCAPQYCSVFAGIQMALACTYTVRWAYYFYSTFWIFSCWLSLINFSHHSIWAERKLTLSHYSSSSRGSTLLRTCFINWLVQKLDSLLGRYMLGQARNHTHTHLQFLTTAYQTYAAIHTYPLSLSPSFTHTNTDRRIGNMVYVTSNIYPWSSLVDVLWKRFKVTSDNYS